MENLNSNEIMDVTVMELPTECEDEEYCEISTGQKVAVGVAGVSLLALAGYGGYKLGKKGIRWIKGKVKAHKERKEAEAELKKLEGDVEEESAE